MSMFLFADQKIMSAILPELQQEYGVKENVLGWIGSAFTLVGAFISVFFGYFADIISRKKLLVLTVIIGEIPCLLTGFEVFTPNIQSFIILRILTGIGLGGIFPLTFSLISDYFREEYRAIATGWLSVAWAIGMLVGPGIAGYLTEAHGWRLSFILAAVPNFPLVLIFAFIADDPPKGRSEKAFSDLDSEVEYDKKIKLGDFKIIFSNKTNLFVFLQGIFGTIPWGILGYWAILFFEREKNLAKDSATTIYLAMGLGVMIGTVFWVYVGTILYKKNPKYLFYLCATGVFFGIIPTTLVYNMSVAPGWIPALYTLSFLGGALIAVAAGNIKAILMNVNRPEHRGSVFAIFNITDNLGQGFGPALGGMLLPFGFHFMVNFSVFMWVPCGIFLLCGAFTIEKDRQKLQEYLDEEAQNIKRKKESTAITTN